MFDVLAFYGEMFSPERFLVGTEGQKHRARRAQTLLSCQNLLVFLLLPRDAQLEVQGLAATAITKEYLDCLFSLVELRLLVLCTFFFYPLRQEFLGLKPGEKQEKP